MVLVFSSHLKSEKIAKNWLLFETSNDFEAQRNKNFPNAKTNGEVFFCSFFTTRVCPDKSRPRLLLSFPAFSGRSFITLSLSLSLSLSHSFSFELSRLVDRGASVSRVSRHMEMVEAQQQQEQRLREARPLQFPGFQRSKFNKCCSCQEIKMYRRTKSNIF